MYLHRSRFSLGLVALLIGCTSGSGGNTQSTTAASTTVTETEASTTEGSTSEGPTTDDKTTNVTNSSETTNSSDTSESEQGPVEPVIELLVPSQLSLTEGESITFTATVSDLNGPDDISGGVLLNFEGDVTIGNFTKFDDNTYTITLMWSELNLVESLTFDEEILRMFRARFTDSTDLTGEATVGLTLTCNGQVACEGSCGPLGTDDDNCGVCPVACAGNAVCSGGECVPGSFGECFDPMAMTCAEFCGGSEQVCIDAGCNGDTYRGYSSFADCEADINSSYISADCDSMANCDFICDPPIAVRCCCA